jgi:hypothetical protein
VITLGAQPNQIDLLTSMSTECADAVFADLHITEIWGMRIPVVSRRSLLQAKKETNRPKDRIDYEELIAMTTGCESYSPHNPASFCRKFRNRRKK